MRSYGVPIAILLSVVSMASSQTRVYQYGSNPYLSTELYPQDYSLLPVNRLSFFPSYRQDPWWGDVDEPGNKPKPTYTTTGATVVDGDTWFEHSGKTHTSANDLGYRYALPKSWVMDLDLQYMVNASTVDAGGHMTDSEGEGYIPFEYSLSHTLNELDVRLAIAPVTITIEIAG